MTTQLFGEPVPRREDARLLRGEGRFVDDIGHDAWEVAILRSPHAHARIVDIDVSEALEVDGLIAIHTHEDLPPRLQRPLPLPRATVKRRNSSVRPLSNQLTTLRGTNSSRSTS